jgi:Ankyrin repeats (many copies)
MESTEPLKPEEELRRLGVEYNERAFLKYSSLGDVAVVRLFVAAGIRVSAKNRRGQTAVVLASKNGHTDVVRMLIGAGADVDGLVETIRSRPGKDRWDKLAALSSIATVVSGLLIATLGGYFTYSYNSAQVRMARLQSDRDETNKVQQNRLLELQIVERMIPQLTKNEKSKELALLAITELGSPKLAARLAESYRGKGSIQALQQMAVSGDKTTRREAASAISNIVASARGDDLANALLAMLHLRVQQSATYLAFIRKKYEHDDVLLSDMSPKYVTAKKLYGEAGSSYNAWLSSTKAAIAAGTLLGDKNVEYAKVSDNATKAISSFNLYVEKDMKDDSLDLNLMMGDLLNRRYTNLKEIGERVVVTYKDRPAAERAKLAADFAIRCQWVEIPKLDLLEFFSQTTPA